MTVNTVQLVIGIVLAVIGTILGISFLKSKFQDANRLNDPRAALPGFSRHNSRQTALLNWALVLLLIGMVLMVTSVNR